MLTKFKKSRCLGLTLKMRNFATILTLPYTRYLRWYFSKLSLSPKYKNPPSYSGGILIQITTKSCQDVYNDRFAKNPIVVDVVFVAVALIHG